MLSRRSVRVKIMQILYAANRNKETSWSVHKKHYWEEVDRTKELMLFSLFNLIKVCEVATEDAKQRVSKYLPTEEDKYFTAKLYDNTYTQKLVSQPNVSVLYEKYGFADTVDSDFHTKIYYEFAKTEGYNEYLKSEDSSELVQTILLDLAKFCFNHETFKELIEDRYSNWEEDRGITFATVKRIIKMLKKDGPVDVMDFFPDSELIEDFGENLLLRTFKEDATLLNKIEPALINWDSDRIAIMDLIFLKMAVAEYLYFETIPPKATINEYVELAKKYSTDKSKDFINGILENLKNTLTESGEMVKKGRGLIDE